MLAQKKQIELLKSRDEANEKMISLVEKSGTKIRTFGCH